MSTNAERSADAMAAAAARQVAAQVAPSAAMDLTQADLTKLDGIETGATANDTNANLRARSTHTGTQLASTISDFAASVLATVLTGLSLATGIAITAADTVLSAMGKLQKQITDHLANLSNPHAVTKTQVGLGNADDTSDASKPVSTAQQTALDLKANAAQPAFTAPTLLNSWVNFGGAVQAPSGFYKSTTGRVYLRGLVKDGTVALPVFTLPAGSRPAFRELFAVDNAGVFGSVYVDQNGDVVLGAGGNAYLSLAGISFVAA